MADGQNQTLNKKELRIFNLIWTVIFLIIGALPIISGKDLRTWSIIVSALFFVTAIAFPYLTLPFYRIWVKFGGFIGRVNSKIILSIIFFLIITPVGFLMRLMGKDLLSKRINKESKTYFKERETQPGSMKNQF